MRKEVEQYLESCSDKKKAAEQNKRKEVLIIAGLYTYPEITEDEYDLLDYEQVFIKTIDGEKHFFKNEKVPLEVTDEEYAAILAVTDEVEKEEEETTSGAATFFTVIAWILWIGGLIVAIALSYETRFNFGNFITTLISYLLYGSFCMCASELFKKLASINNTLSDIKKKIK